MHKVKKCCQNCRFHRKIKDAIFCVCWYSPLKGEETYNDESCEFWYFGTKHSSNTKKKNKKNLEKVKK